MLLIAIAPLLLGEGPETEPAMAGARPAWLADPIDDPAPGLLLWGGMNLQGLSEAISKYRLLAGSAEFDDPFASERNSHPAHF